MPYNLAEVRATISRSVKDFAEKRCAQYMEQAELHLAQREACAGNAQLFMKRVRETITELEGRVDELERIKATQRPDPRAEMRRLRFD